MVVSYEVKIKGKMSYITNTVNNNISELAQFKQVASKDYLRKIVQLTRTELHTMELGFSKLFSKCQSERRDISAEKMLQQIISDFDPFLEEAKIFVLKNLDMNNETVLGIKMSFFAENLKNEDMSALELATITCRSSLRLLEEYLAYVGVCGNAKEALVSLDPLLAQIEIDVTDPKALFTFFHQLASKILENENIDSAKSAVT